MKKSTTLVLLLFALVFFAAGQTGPFSVSAASNKANHPPASFGLPFYENWSSGSLETNNWTADCDYWAIDGMVGNEKPSAKFSGSPLVQEQYTCSLVSDTFNGDLFKVGQIMLEFDISLNNRINTGTEKLLVEVLDSTGWNTVAEFTNDGSFDWSAHSVDIADYALGQTFQIRFKATGPNSFNVKSWHIDNISLHRSCEAPKAMDLQFFWEYPNTWGTELDWKAPPSTIIDAFKWLHWDNQQSEAVGLTAGGDFSVAAQWDSLQLAEYAGDTIGAIRFFLNDDGYSAIIAKIWTGESAENLIYQDTIENPVAEDWNEHILDTVILLNPVDNYRFGYEIVGQPPGKYPAALDYGPAIPGYGDLIFTETDGWSNLSDYGIDNNLNIRVKLINNDTSDLACKGFNVYRKQASEEDYAFHKFVAFVENQTAYFLRDTLYDPDYLPICYRITATWSQDGDTCISPYAKDFYYLDDFICLYIAGTEQNKNNPLSIYPNPATSKLNITTKDGTAIEEIRIYNLTGQLVFWGEMKNNSIDISRLQDGMYVVEVMIGQRKIRKKLIVE